FLLRLRVAYPAADEERTMLYRFKEQQPLEQLTPVVTGEHLLGLLGVVRAVRVAPAVADYVLGIVRATREHPAIELGASPRAALGLFRAAQARAALQGRAYVKPDDVKRLAVPVLAHRLVVTAQTRLRGQGAEQIVQAVVDRTPVPVEDIGDERR